MRLISIIGGFFRSIFSRKKKPIAPMVASKKASFGDTSPGMRALESLERQLAKKGHKRMGLPTPPKDLRKRRAWLIKVAEKQAKDGIR